MKLRIMNLVGWAVLAMSLPVSAAVVTFQDGITNTFVSNYTGTEDNTVVSGNLSDLNNGARTTMFVGGNTSRAWRGLIRFDLTSMAATPGLEVMGATLRLSVNEIEGTFANQTINLYRVSAANSGWVEGTGDFSGAAPGESAWDWRSRPTAWAGSAGLSTAGTDYLSTPVASLTLSTPPNFPSTVDFVFTDVSFFTDWISGNNSGLLIYSPDLEALQLRLITYTSEQSNTALRPQLILEFAGPVPEPSVAALLAVAGAIVWRRGRKKME